MITRIRYCFVVTALCSLFACACLPAIADTTGALSGRVYLDSNDSPNLGGVAVTAASWGGQFETVTDAHGFFAFISLPPGIYTVAMTKLGFNPQSVRGICVPAGEHPFYSLRLGYRFDHSYYHRTETYRPNLGVSSVLYDSMCRRAEAIPDFPSASPWAPFLF